jgi:hypothetical protein
MPRILCSHLLVSVRRSREILQHVHILNYLGFNLLYEEIYLNVKTGT